MARHLMIAGHGRAGTTLFYNMLRETLKGFEIPPRETSALSTIGQPGDWVSKRPLDIFQIANIARANVRNKRIDLIVPLRDPRDILVSRHSAVPDDYFISSDAMYFIGGPDAPVPVMPGLLHIHEAIATVLKSGIFPQGVFLLKYEDLADDPDRIQQKLRDALDLKFEGHFSDFGAAEIPEDLKGPLNGIRPVEKARAKWRDEEHRARICDQFSRFPVLFDLLEQLGYEKNRDWFAPFMEWQAASGRRSKRLGLV
ncbi:hypothetical protein [Thioclava sp. DLFJ4-1]|uniref:hypothetical protein n=1 Tax=Thioclava sp. DLFJ4-1 TaxID=1915313 RepID=UPI00099831F2|nr:hypothetical protein [Thioclava sp. DLFJ4-1]OOY15259.1 hypothetical protein BMI85_17140 [Thioclava sp. DLFJ4-1]